MFRSHALAALLALGLASATLLAAPAGDLTPAQALADVRLAERALLALHSGLYRYRTPAQIDAEFKRTEDAVRAGASRASMYVQISHLAAAVRCGHTWTNPLNQSEAVRQMLSDGQDKLPLRVRAVGNRLLVTASTVAQVRPGDELVAIDGRPADALIGDMLPLLRADGSNDGKRRSQIDSGANGGAMDRLFPLLHPPIAGRFELRLRHGTEAPFDVAVEATTLQRREGTLAAMGLPEPGDAWAFALHDGLAVLTIPTFSFWRSEFDWKGFLDRSFDEMRTHHATGLVIDLRRNEGGDDAIGHALLGHLLARAYTPPVGAAEVRFERVPYALARFLDTWDFGFFDHTGQVQPMSGGRYRLPGSVEGGMAVTPAEPAFRGRVVALVGPQMSSAGFLIARDLQASHAALLVGQQTGGSLRGMNGGQLAWLTLPNSGVAIDIPLVAWVPAGDPPDHGVLPDEDVPQDFGSIAQGGDVDMAAALALIAQDSRW